MFLDLVLGAPILPFNQEFKSRKVEEGSGNVVTLEDDFTFIKMDVKGPDILKLPHIKVPDSMKVILKTNSLTTMNNNSLLKRRRTTGHGRLKGNWVPVVYVYQIDDDTNPTKYKFIQRYLDEDDEKMVWKPVMLAPLGESYSHPFMPPSNRYVSCMCIYFKFINYTNNSIQI